MSRNIRWDDSLLENVLILVEALLELSEKQTDNEKLPLWVEWKEDKLRVTGYQTKQTKGKRSRTPESGTKKEHLIQQIKATGKSLKFSQQTEEKDKIQNVLDCLKELEIREDEESKKNQGYWKFSLKLKHQTATREENLEVIRKKWREHPKTNPRKTVQKSSIKDNDIWREIFHNKLEKQLQYIRHKATEKGFEVNVHVPLGLVERKEQQRRDKHSSPDNPYQLEKEVIVKIYEHDAFLREVIDSKSAEKKKHIAIIGEAGAGKTTLLSQVAEYLKDETEYLPIWISLADLQGKTLENFLLNTWFPNIKYSSIKSPKTTDELKKRFSQGDIYLLLDGVDEMAENSPLDALTIGKLPDWLRKARFVLTCRLNVWDERVNNPLTGFETYKTQEFKPEQVDEFIQDWFQCAENIDKGSTEKGKALQTKLKETRHQKIRSLVTNPLRLSLLCQTFYLDKQGELPETKAGLYERFIRYFYGWKPRNIPDDLRNSDDKKDELHQALSKLALEGIDSGKRFRLNRKFVHQQMGEKLFKLACDVGWLNLVDRDAKTDRDAHSLGKIDPGNENAINALVELICNSNDDSTKYNAAHSLGKIDPGNENAINALVDLIRNSNNDSTKYNAAHSLGEILKNKHMPTVVTTLQPYLSVETYNNNPSQFESCYRIIWECAENMTYPEFYQAWHQQA